MAFGRDKGKGKAPAEDSQPPKRKTKGKERRLVDEREEEEALFAAAAQGTQPAKKKMKKPEKQPFSLPPEVLTKASARDKTRFVSAMAQARYLEMREERRVYIPERGIRVDHLDDDRLVPALAYHKWNGLAMHPSEKASMTLAMEVYANVFAATDPSKIVIHGVKVDFSPAGINKHYGTPNEGQTYLTTPLYPEWHLLTRPEEPKMGKRNKEISVSNIMMPWKSMAKLWLGRVKTTVHEHALTDSCFPYIFALAHGQRINVGEYIYTRMKELAKEKNGPMTYLHLIKNMCAAAGYKAPSDHLDMEPGGPYQVMDYHERKKDLDTGIAGPVIIRDDFDSDLGCAHEQFIVEVEPNLVSAPAERANDELPDVEPEQQAPIPPPATGSMTEVMEMLRNMQVQQQDMQRGQDEFYGAVYERLDTMTTDIRGMQREQQWIRTTVTQFGRSMQSQFPDMPGFQFPPWDGSGGQ